MGSVFISHSWSDKPLARRLAITLRRASISVWLDEAEIKIGDSLIEKIREGIETVDYVVAVLSDHANQSEWVKRELEIAINEEISGKKVKVLPVLADECEVPAFLRGKLYADMSSDEKYLDALEMLFRRLDVDIRIADQLLSIEKGEDEVSDIERVSAAVSMIVDGDLDQIISSLEDLDFNRHGEYIKQSGGVSKLIELSSSEYSGYIRLLAIGKLSDLGGSAATNVLKLSLDDPELAVNVAAIDGATKTEDRILFPKILSIFETSQERQVFEACLRYFAKVKVRDATLNTRVCMKLLDAFQSSDAVKRVALIDPIAKQVSHFDETSDDLFDAILQCPDDALVMAFLECLVRHENYDFYVLDIVSKTKLLDIVSRLVVSNDLRTRIRAWTFSLSWYQDNHARTWEQILSEDAAIVSEYVDFTSWTDELIPIGEMVLSTDVRKIFLDYIRSNMESKISASLVSILYSSISKESFPIIRDLFELGFFERSRSLIRFLALSGDNLELGAEFVDRVISSSPKKRDGVYEFCVGFSLEGSTLFDALEEVGSDDWGRYLGDHEKKQQRVALERVHRAVSGPEKRKLSTIIKKIKI
ncbi:MAG: toll/interleukin-1 receptor domain-containing protein [Paracoccaceae bacterium]|nr:toll/interleukin-1 receptor domain-containing protein [Paracoccaceae bacterium]